MNPYAEEKIMFAHQAEIAAQVKHNAQVEQAKQIKRETEAGEIVSTGWRQQLGQLIVHFGYKVAGRSQASLQVKG